MKKVTKITPLASVVLLSLSSCGKTSIPREEDKRDLSMEESTLLNLSATDALGREVKVQDARNTKRKTGLFYHIWHGTHNTKCEDISSRFNISNLLENDPESLWDASIDPDKFFYWGEPLYGYYNSADPWVITRHVELLTNAGIDYLAYDMTNTVIYPQVVDKLFEILDKYQKQGFNVPKVVFVTHSSSGQTMKRCYEYWYKDGAYKNLWYSRDGKRPYIIGDSYDLLDVYRKQGKEEEGQEVVNFFDVGEVLWPDDVFQDPEGSPWMDWTYPQRNYNGTMVVSLAQHPGYKMSDRESTNHGRGFDFTDFTNKSWNVPSGTNFAQQFQTVFNSNDPTHPLYDEENEVNNVFITGFNEWIAVKQIDQQGNPFWCDTFNEEYSRDIEMCKNGYGDNYYLELLELNRQYAYEEAKHYNYNLNTIDITDTSLEGWNKVKTNFKDFEGDALSRNFISADQTHYLTNDTNRNDIVKTSITHDANNLYVKVETKDALTDRDPSDMTFMNVMINTKKNPNDNFMGFDYVINRSQNGDKCSIERLKKGFETSKVDETRINISNNVMQLEIPLKSLGLSKEECNISLKVSDHVEEQENELAYYVDGDSAPIGRLGYDYGY